MTSHPPAQRAPAGDKVGALEELLGVEREISDQLAETDADVERMLAATRDTIAARRVAASEQLVQELTALELRLRAAAAEEASTLIDATRTTAAEFDHATDADVASLADFVLRRVYDVTPTPPEQTS